MLLREFEDQDLETAYYDPSYDEYNTRKITDQRRPILTLKHLNRLKKLRIFNELERLKREDLFSVMYGIPDEAAAGGGPVGF